MAITKGHFADLLGSMGSLGNAMKSMHDQRQQAMDYTAGLNKIYPGQQMLQYNPYGEQARQTQMQDANNHALQQAAINSYGLQPPYAENLFKLPQTQPKLSQSKAYTEDSAHAAMYGMSVEMYRKYNAKRRLGVLEGQEVTNSQWLDIQIESTRVRL